MQVRASFLRAWRRKRRGVARPDACPLCSAMNPPRGLSQGWGSFWPLFSPDPTCNNGYIRLLSSWTKYKPESTNSSLKWWFIRLNFMNYKYIFYLHFELRLDPEPDFFSSAEPDPRKKIGSSSLLHGRQKHLKSANLLYFSSMESLDSSDITTSGAENTSSEFSGFIPRSRQMCQT